MYSVFFIVLTFALEWLPAKKMAGHPENLPITHERKENHNSQFQ